MKKINHIVIVSLFIAALFSSCNNMLDIKPSDPSTILEEKALKTGSDLQGLLNASYQSLQDVYGGAFQRYSDLMADETYPLQPTSDKRLNIYKRYTTGYFTANEPYSNAYVSILRANLVIENVDKVSGLTDAQKKQMVGEAKFIRALCHYAVVRMFAQPYGYTANNTHLGIGLKTTSKPSIIPRSTVADVYKQILADLNDAEGVLPTTNSNGAYATKWAAKGLLADVYFQMHDYENAYTKANDVITNGGFQFDANVESRFIMKQTTFTYGSVSLTVDPSKETIFQLVSTNTTSQNTNAGSNFGDYRCDGTNIPQIRIDKNFYTQNAAAIAVDKRARAWYQTFNSGLTNEYIGLAKFNFNNMNVPLIHLTELKLIRAEAAALKATKDLATAIADINDIRMRAYSNDEIYKIPANATAEDILTVVRAEKRLELVGEGYRVYDLKRRGSGGESELMIRGVKWNYPGLALQFPINEINEVFLPNEEPF
ncbi:MAG: RagB/SusD family nutrient uptake outer membrane protein [Bacteroidota bacterium]|nr:RagB/SusD family nutrient uptake outer membrane protein [Bacteroidota bacterium]MDP4204519.1 RagB/SusD family nutrient uptake outer membrane protein [Bacteroidota bacterium]